MTEQERPSTEDPQRPERETEQLPGQEAPLRDDPPPARKRPKVLPGIRQAIKKWKVFVPGWMLPNDEVEVQR